MQTHQNTPFDSSKFWLFSPAPPEIGEVLSANSEAKVGQKPNSILWRLLMALFVGAFGFGIGFVVGLFVGSLLGAIISKAAAQYVVFACGAIGGGIGVWLGWLAGAMGGECNYVGKEGLVKFIFYGTEEDKKPLKLMRFSEAHSLMAKNTRIYRNGNYVHTEYEYQWRGGEDNTTKFTISGNYDAEKGAPPESTYHFALAAEKAWNAQLLDRAVDELNTRGFMEFDLDILRKDKIRVGKGFLEFVSGSKVERWSSGEISNITINAGNFTVKHRDAKEGFFSKKGIHEFQYGSMANAAFFLIALKQLAGFSFLQKD